jgi:uncharacterized RDD family membrane protein YckC
MPAVHRSDVEVAEVGELGEAPLATYGSRIAARLVDALIVYVPVYFPLVFFVHGFGMSALIYMAVLVVYDVVFTARTGATPGKRFTRIKVVSASTGAPPGWVRAVARALALGVLTWAVNGLVALFDERRHRGLHDRVAGTLVLAA